MKVKSSIFLLMLSVSLILVSCNNESSNEDREDILKYKTMYMEFREPYQWVTNEPEPGMVTLEYYNGKIIRKNGDIAESDPFFPLYIISKEIYTPVVYEEDKITITKEFATLGYSSDYKKEIFLNNNQIEKIVKYDQSQIFGADTTFVYYENGRISKTIKRLNTPLNESKYFYNTNNNLDSIVMRYYKINPVNNSLYIDYNSKIREVIVFSNYDNLYNPFKKLIIFDESYFRALSENNYAKISYQGYDSDGNVYLTRVKNWTFILNNGEVDFSQ